MEPTLKAGDVILVNKIGRSIATLGGSHFMPQRGQLVVFKNPLYAPAATDEAVAIKRIVGLPGERVVVRDGHITIFNNTQPEGFNPDAKINTIQQPTSGNVDRVVPEDELFVAGDNRIGSYSFDSRNGLSTVPLREIEGVVLWRVFPLTAWGGL
jgi:signal peptidase I